ncbi:MAG: GldG family protein [Candidatus Riflebacteria bacterium]|nr:GldG family protein [Candidatus Riflebacteria bacterium]
MRTTLAAPLVLLLGLGLTLLGLVAAAAGLSGSGFIWPGVGLAAGALFAARDRLRPSLGPGILLGLYLGLSLCIVAGLDILLERHRVRFDLTAREVFTLSDQTRKVLSGLGEELRITVIFRANSPGRHLARDLLGQYRQASGHIRVDFLDPDLKPSLARNFPGTARGAIVVRLAGRERIVRWPSEREVTLAIASLLKTRQPLVAFATGSGEPEVDDKGPLGCTMARAVLEHENYRVGSIDLMQVASAPALLVLPFARQDLGPAAVENLQRLHRAGASILALVEPGPVHPRLEGLLADWGVLWEGAKAHDLDSHLPGDPGTALVEKYPDHPLTLGLASTHFPGVTALGFQAGDRTPWKPLVILSAGSTSTMPDGREGPAGSLVVAAACAGSDGKRLAVVGDSDFLANATLARFPANREFLLGLVNWLTQREAMLGEFPERRAGQRLYLTERHLKALAAVTLLGVPAMLLLVALYFWMEARKP